MNEKSLSEPGTSEGAFSSLVAELAASMVKGRSGMGAFRHHTRLAYDTVKVILGSSILAPKISEYAYPDEPMFHRRWRDDYDYLALGQLVQVWLVDPSNFNPAAMWAVFWALMRAEERFLLKYLPYWSHEERLTGHLISQVIERVEDFRAQWQRLARTTGPEHLPLCEIYYADTATGRREASTGADLALILHCSYEWHEEFFKVARFQSKKVGQAGKSQINMQQLGPLTTRANLGYYLFYHFPSDSGWKLTPTVRAAQEVADALQEETTEGQPKTSGKRALEAAGSGWDFASFVTFAMCDPGAKQGAFASSASEAVRLALSTNLGPAPSRLLVITLGRGASGVRWSELARDYIAVSSDD